MPDNLLQVYIHFVWATWDRLPLLNDMAIKAAYTSIQAKCVELKVELLEIGGVEDHVHILVKLCAILSIAELVKHVKGASSRSVNINTEDTQFNWQGGYGAISISPKHVPKIREYIRNQKQHHQEGKLNHLLEQTSSEEDAVE